MIGFILPPTTPNPAAAIRDAGSASPDVRWVAASALGRVDGELRDRALAALHKLMTDASGEVRAQATEGMIEQCAKDEGLSLEWIPASLKDASAAVRCVGVDAATALLDAPQDVISPLLADADPSVRAAAVSALGEIGDTKMSGVVSALLADDDRWVRRAAAIAAAALKHEAAEPHLLGLLSSSDELTVNDAIRGLGQIRSRAAVVPLRKLIAKFFGSIRIKTAAAASLFACTGGEEGGDVIRGFLSARKTETKISMLTALYQLPMPGLSSFTAEVIAAKDEMAASAAIQTLSSLCSVDREAVTAMSLLRGKLSGATAEELEAVWSEINGEPK